jgi:glucosamine-6-phosphate deaminase
MLVVKIFPGTGRNGKKSSRRMYQKKFNELFKGKADEINMIFAAAPSQSDFIKTSKRRQLTFSGNKINAFHMDEYIGLDKRCTASFWQLFDGQAFWQSAIQKCKLYQRTC